LDVRLVQEPSKKVKIYEVVVGGGKTQNTKSVDCTKNKRILKETDDK
jgi:hypothetical protein